MDARPQRRQVLSTQTADTMTHLMLGVVEQGTATRVQVLGRPVGGKTGTTNQTRDAWFIGFTPSLITGVWVGMDYERSLGKKETGSQAAAPIFINYMQTALKGQPAEQFGQEVRNTPARDEPEVEYDEEEPADRTGRFLP